MHGGEDVGDNGSEDGSDDIGEEGCQDGGEDVVMMVSRLWC